MDLEARRKLGGLIDKATSTGHLSLEPLPLRQIKAIAKKSDENVKSAFHFVSQKLKADSSEVRYLALLLVNEFFTRSACFRALLVDDFQNFLELVVGTKVYKPLPPPSERAVQLRQKGLEFIENWHEQFGHANKQLRVGHHYLKHSLRMRFPEVRLQSEIAERERKQREEQTQKILRVKFERVQKEVEEHVGELEALLREMDGCFDILMPRDFDAPPAAASTAAASPASVGEGKGKEKATDNDLADESFNLDKYAADEDELEWESAVGGQLEEEDEDEDEEEEVDDVLRRHGIGSGGAYELNISFDKSFASVMEEENDGDNGGGEERDHALKAGTGDQEERQETSKPVAECLRNNLRAVTRRYGPLVDEWYDVALKVDFPLPNTDTTPTSQELREGEKRRVRDRLLRQVIELRSAMSAAVRKCADLGIAVGEPKRLVGTDDDGTKSELRTTSETGTATSQGVRREGEVGEEGSETMATATSTSPSTTTSSSSSPSHQSQSQHKRTLAELFGDSDDDDDDASENKNDQNYDKDDDAEENERKRAKLDVVKKTNDDDEDEEEDEDELEFEEVSMIADADEEAYGDDDNEDEADAESRSAGDESMVADSPVPASRTLVGRLTSSPSSVPPSPYAAAATRTSSASTSPADGAKAKSKSKKDDVKVRERLRRRLGMSAKRRPPAVKPHGKTLSTHRPLQL